MMKRYKTFLAALAVSVFGAFALAPVTPVAALDPLAAPCKNASGSEICKNKNEKAEPLIGKIVNVMLFITGAISTIMIIVGGIFYAISTGDSGKVARAKNTIMYAIVGLVVSLLAYAIINFVLGVFN